MKFLALGLLLISSLALGQQTGSQKKYDPPFNLLDNGNFEKKLSGWTNSGGTFSHVVSGSNLIFDKGSATFDASATSQYIQTKLYTVTEGLKGASCMGRVYYKGGDSNLVLKVLDGSSNLLGSTTFAAATATSVLNVAFPCPSSGSVRLRVESTANAAIVAVDNAHVGVADNLVKISQAQFIGSAQIYAASCAWAESGATLAEPAVDTDCTGPQIELNPGPGVIQTTDTDLPRFTVNALPPGNYMVTMTMLLNAGTGNAGAAISDGTTVTGHSGGDGSNNRSVTLVGTYSYTDSGNRTFRVLLNNTSDTTTLNANDLSSAWRLKFSIYKFPSAQEQAFTPAQVANSWSGYHDDDCDFQNGNASFIDFVADATCTFTQRTNVNFGTVTSALDTGNPIPGIVFTPSRAGTYKICAITQAGQSTAAQNISLRLYDGTTELVQVNAVGKVTGSYSEVVPLCGLYTVTSLSPKTITIQGRTGGGTMSISGSWNGSAINAVEWSIFQIDQSLPAPLLVNTVVSPSSGIEQVVRARITNPGTCVVGSQSGAWISSVTDPAAGECGINIEAGTFSATPSCVCSAAVDAATICQIKAGATSTSMIVKTFDDAGVAADQDFNIMCMGPK